MRNNQHANQAMPVDLDALKALYTAMLDHIKNGKLTVADSFACTIANAAPDLIAELRELRELREANRWRPIADATKDNTGIEAIDSRTGFVRVVDYYKGYPPNWIPCWALQGASNECYPLDYFTHYRPIPHPPESA